MISTDTFLSVSKSDLGIELSGRKDLAIVLPPAERISVRVTAGESVSGSRDEVRQYLRSRGCLACDLEHCGRNAANEPVVAWRGSVGDLATDLVAMLTPAQLKNLADGLNEKAETSAVREAPAIRPEAIPPL